MTHWGNSLQNAVSIHSQQKQDHVPGHHVHLKALPLVKTLSCLLQPHTRWAFSITATTSRQALYHRETPRTHNKLSTEPITKSLPQSAMYTNLKNIEEEKKKSTETRPGPQFSPPPAPTAPLTTNDPSSGRLVEVLALFHERLQCDVRHLHPSSGCRFPRFWRVPLELCAWQDRLAVAAGAGRTWTDAAARVTLRLLQQQQRQIISLSIKEVTLHLDLLTWTLLGYLLDIYVQSTVT